MKDIYCKLEKTIGRERFKHSLRVRDFALKLGETYELDLHKLETAALLHDCAKYKDKDLLLKKSKDFDIIKDTLSDYNIELLHGPLGREVAREEYSIVDEDILRAIEFHTTARPDMTDLEKVIYISDFVELGRKIEGLDKVREMAFINLDRAVLMKMDMTISYLIDRGQGVSLNTVEARNQLLRDMKNLEG